MDAETLLNEFDLLLDAPESVPKLREVILQLAVEGKLVNQDASDEPAEALLEQIAQVKEKLYEESEISRRHSYPPEFEEGPHPLPEGWTWVRINHAGVVNPRLDEDEELDASFVPMKRIEDGVGTGHTSETRRWGDIRRGYTHFGEGDVGIAKITPCFQNVKSTVFEGLENGIGAGTTELYIFRPVAGTILPRYALAFFQSADFIAEGVRQMTGTAGQQRVPREYVEESFLPLPPLAEQERIVAKVNALMAQCDRLEAQQAEREETRAFFSEATLGCLQRAEEHELAERWAFTRAHFGRVASRPEDVQALRQTLLQLAVEGKLTEQRPSDEPAEKLLERIEAEKQRLYEVGEIRKPKSASPVSQDERPTTLPDNWQWVRVGEISNMQGGYAFKSSNYTDSGVRLVRNANIGHGSIDWGDTARIAGDRYEDFERFQLEEGEILLSLDRPIISTGLKVARVRKNDLPALLLQRVGRFEPFDSSVNEFLFLWLHSVLFLRGIDPGRSSGVPHISQKDVLKLVFPFPPLAEQHRIVAKVDQLMAFCDELEAKLERSQETTGLLLDAVLHAAEPEAEGEAETVTARA